MTRILAGPGRRLAALGLLLACIDPCALALHGPGADTVGSPARANAFVGALGLPVWLGPAPLLLLIDPCDDRFLWPSLVFVPGLVLAARPLRRARGAHPAALPRGTAR